MHKPHPASHINSGITNLTNKITQISHTKLKIMSKENKEMEAQEILHIEGSSVAPANRQLNINVMNLCFTNLPSVSVYGVAHIYRVYHIVQ